MALRDFVRAFKRRICAHRVCVMRLYHHDLRIIPALDVDATVRITKLERGCIDTVLQVYPVDLEEDHRRLASGQSCYVAWVSGRAAHFSWVQDKGAHDVWATGRRRKLRQGDLWIYSCRTADWARGMHLYPGTLVHILREYAEKNYHYAFIYVDERNAASIRGIERAGFVLRRRFRALSVSRFCIPLP